jgi:hypothetical protein
MHDYPLPQAGKPVLPQSAFVDSFPHSLTVCFPDRLESLSCVHRPPPIVPPAVRDPWSAFVDSFDIR